MKNLEINVKNIPVISRPRKLKEKWTSELGADLWSRDDMASYHDDCLRLFSLDYKRSPQMNVAEDEIVEMMADEIEAEINDLAYQNIASRTGFEITCSCGCMNEKHPMFEEHMKINSALKTTISHQEMMRFGLYSE